MDHDSVTQFVTAESRTFKRPGSVLVRNMESEFCHGTNLAPIDFTHASHRFFCLPRNLKSCHFGAASVVPGPRPLLFAGMATSTFSNGESVSHKAITGMLAYEACAQVYIGNIR